MSDAEILTFDLPAVAKAVTVPVLMVHGDKSDGGFVSPQWTLDKLVNTHDKTLTRFESTIHTAFYDDPAVIDKAVSVIATWVYNKLS